MTHGDVMGVAVWINEQCNRLQVSDSDRGWCHELHGKVRVKGGTDQDVRNAVIAFLDQRLYSIDS